MIGHHHKFAQRYVWRTVGNLVPHDIGNHPSPRQMHDSFLDFTEKMVSVLGADGHKIGSVLLVVPPGGPGGGDAVFIPKFIAHDDTLSSWVMANRS